MYNRLLAFCCWAMFSSVCDCAEFGVSGCIMFGLTEKKWCLQKIFSSSEKQESIVGENITKKKNLNDEDIHPVKKETTQRRVILFGLS